jgi:hypothetical protein
MTLPVWRPTNTAAFLAKADAIDAQQAATMIIGAHDLTVAATLDVQSAERVVDVRRMLGFSTHPSLRVAACGTDDEVRD